MSKRTIGKPSIKTIRRLKFYMIIGYVLILIAAIMSVSFLYMKKTDEVIINKVTEMSSSLSTQMKLNLEGYLSRIETIGALAFGDETTYSYDATDPSNDEYEAISTEKRITDKLSSLCIMDNLVDYGIIYSNNRSVGKISNSTTTLFGENMFKELSSMITRHRTNDGWAAGCKGDYRRIYYVKRVHSNAILIISFYVKELESVFDSSEINGNMTVRLVDDQNNIIYSFDRDEIGTEIATAITERTKDKNSAVMMDDKYLISIEKNGKWHIVTTIDTASLLHEKNNMHIYIYLTAAIAALLSALIAVRFSFRITAPVTDVVMHLDTKASIDQLTGVFNKLTFEDAVNQHFENRKDSEKYAFILLDLDNFKGVNDNLGHAYGDRVLAKTGSILRFVFSDDTDISGRLGGDEFGALMRLDDESSFDVLNQKCADLCDAFSTHYTGDDGKYKISASIGAAIFPDHGNNFADIYSSADKALYYSKGKGKDTYTIYDGGHNKEDKQ